MVRKISKKEDKKVGLIYSRISGVMADIGPVAKNSSNDAQRYKFRGVDAVYNELNKHMAKHQVFTTSEIVSEKNEERPSKNGGMLIYRILNIRFTFFTVDGSFVKTNTIGEGMDSGDKASNKAMSVAHKYALLQVFCIPTQDVKDPEADSPELISDANYLISANAKANSVKNLETLSYIWDTHKRLQTNANFIANMTKNRMRIEKTAAELKQKVVESIQEDAVEEEGTTVNPDDVILPEDLSALDNLDNLYNNVMERD